MYYGSIAGDVQNYVIINNIPHGPIKYHYKREGAMFAEGNTRGNSPQYIGPITLEYFDVLLMWKDWAYTAYLSLSLLGMRMSCCMGLYLWLVVVITAIERM